jgi:DNA-binding FadR family transcriptional regulator
MLRLHESIVIEMIEAIVSGRHAPGASLPNEIDLAQASGVSRTAAREAMQKLQSLGLIEVRRRKGASVLPRSHWNLLDATVLDVAVMYVADVEFFQALIEARLLIEPRAAELAAQRANDRDLERIEAALTSMGLRLKERAEALGTTLTCRSTLQSSTHPGTGFYAIDRDDPGSACRRDPHDGSACGLPGRFLAAAPERL